MIDSESMLTMCEIGTDCFSTTESPYLKELLEQNEISIIGSQIFRSQLDGNCDIENAIICDSSIDHCSIKNCRVERSELWYAEIDGTTYHTTAGLIGSVAIPRNFSTYKITIENGKLDITFTSTRNMWVFKRVEVSDLLYTLSKY